jgi:hypothetical protein
MAEDKKSMTNAAVATLETRLMELEAAFHGLLTHEGALHRDVVSWFSKFRARLAAATALDGVSGGV